MKILMLSGDFLPNVGGITSHIVYLAKALVDRGNEVTILKPDCSEDHEMFHEYGFKVIHLKKKKLDLANKIHIRNKIKKLFEQQKFDVIHWHQLVGYETKFLPYPKIFTNHTSMYLERYESATGRLGLKSMLRHTDAIISPSLELQQKSEIIHPKSGNYYIPNGVDIKKFQPATKISEDGLKGYPKLINKKEQSDKIVLCPRRLEPKCGVDYFIKSIPEILKNHDKVTFVIAGRGGFINEENRMKAWLDDKGILSKVEFLGDVDNNDMPKLYSVSDVVVLPSLMEATSISCLEAMSSGKAIVSTNVGGLPELLTQGSSGVLVPPRDSSALAREISNLLADSSGCILLGNNARKRVEESFSWDIIASKTETIYKKVMNEYAGSSN